MIFVERNTYSSLYRRTNGLLVEIPHGPLTKYDLDDDVLQTLWSLHGTLPNVPRGAYGRLEPFREWLRPRLEWPDDADRVVLCDDCHDPVDTDSENVQTVRGSDHVCYSCSGNYYSCGDCGESVHSEDSVYTLHDESVCQSCADYRYSFCDDCEGYFHGDYFDEHQHGGCDCEASHQTFRVRNGDELLINDTRATVALPAGVISSQGVEQIRRAIQDHAQALPFADEDGTMSETRRDLYAFGWEIDALGSEWQTKQGNYTKRLSRAAHKFRGIKIAPDLLTKIGNVARDNSNGSEYAVEYTRNLNLPAGDFFHEDSCWWQSYSYSRCTLKIHGGIGMRTFGDYGQVTGRAWVMPLVKGEDGALVPTHDTTAADAFVIFNGYGDLSGYAPARIMAQQYGMTYRKIGFDGSPMYVNNGGYLVGAEDIVAPYTDGHLTLHGLDSHGDNY